MNGLWNGRVSYIAYDTLADYEFDVSFTANNGLPVEDLTANFLNFFYENASDTSILSEFEDGERKIGAYDIFWYDDGRWQVRWMGYVPDKTMGVVGFAMSWG